MTAITEHDSSLSRFQSGTLTTNVSMDRRVPGAQGGQYVTSNIEVMCSGCNYIKQHRTRATAKQMVEALRARRGLLKVDEAGLLETPAPAKPYEPTRTERETILAWCTGKAAHSPATALAHGFEADLDPERPLEKLLPILVGPSSFVDPTGVHVDLEDGCLDRIDPSMGYLGRECSIHAHWAEHRPKAGANGGSNRLFRGRDGVSVTSLTPSHRLTGSVIILYDPPLTLYTATCAYAIRCLRFTLCKSFTRVMRTRCNERRVMQCAAVTHAELVQRDHHRGARNESHTNDDGDHGTLSHCIALKEPNEGSARRRRATGTVERGLAFRALCIYRCKLAFCALRTLASSSWPSEPVGRIRMRACIWSDCIFGCMWWLRILPNSGTMDLQRAASQMIAMPASCAAAASDAGRAPPRSCWTQIDARVSRSAGRMAYVLRHRRLLATAGSAYVQTPDTPSHTMQPPRLAALDLVRHPGEPLASAHRQRRQHRRTALL